MVSVYPSKDKRLGSEWAESSDYWISGNAVGDGRKAAWPATWRSHCRRSANCSGGRGNSNFVHGDPLPPSVQSCLSAVLGMTVLEGAAEAHFIGVGFAGGLLARGERWRGGREDRKQREQSHGGSLG